MYCVRSLCPSNETRWRRTTFTTHGKVMQSTPNEDHYGPLQFQTIFLVHCCKIPKFPQDITGHFSLTDGSADWKVYLNYSMEDSNASKKKATSPAATARNFRRSADFDGEFPKKQHWEQHQYAPCDASLIYLTWSATVGQGQSWPWDLYFEQQKYQNGNTT